MRIIIWGTGREARKMLDNGLNAEIVGFVETVKTKDIYKDYPVFTPDNLPDYDYMIVANTFSGEIYDLCLRKGIDLSKVIFMKNDYTHFWNGDEAIVNILGEKNYANYALEYRKWENTFVKFDIEKYNAMNTREEFAIMDKYLYPCISDKYHMNSGMDGYFWQDLWAAKHIISDGVKEHYDIGSRVDGFIAHLLAVNIKVNMIDVRPFPGEAENLNTIVDDATLLRQFDDESIMSLSAMCSLEHFGLGRYGDPVDPEACFKCFEQIQKKLKKSGKLYFSVPIGQDHVEFNAHRVFYANTIVRCMHSLNLMEYSVIADGKIEYDVDIHKYDSLGAGYVIGLFYFQK